MRSFRFPCGGCVAALRLGKLCRRARKEEESLHGEKEGINASNE